MSKIIIINKCRIFLKELRIYMKWGSGEATVFVKIIVVIFSSCNKAKKKIFRKYLARRIPEITINYD